MERTDATDCGIHPYHLSPSAITWGISSIWPWKVTEHKLVDPQVTIFAPSSASVVFQFLVGQPIDNSEQNPDKTFRLQSNM